jgi:hypothetical protein
MMDDLSHFVRSTFSSDRLVRAAPEVVVPLRIPDRSKQFLVTVGLPRAIDFVGGITLRFDLLDRLPTLRQLFPEHADRIDPGWDDCRFLALAPNEYDAGFVLNQADGGSIWSVTLDSTRSDFVNTSVEQFAWFIARWTKWASSSPRRQKPRAALPRNRQNGTRDAIHRPPRHGRRSDLLARHYRRRPPLYLKCYGKQIVSVSPWHTPAILPLLILKIQNHQLPWPQRKPARIRHRDPHRNSPLRPLGVRQLMLRDQLDLRSHLLHP